MENENTETRVFGGKNDKSFWSDKPIQDGHPKDKKGTLICEKITIKSLIKKYANQYNLATKDILNVKCPDEIKIRKQVEQMLLREFIKDLKALT